MENKESYTPQEVALMIQTGAVLVSNLYDGEDILEAIGKYEAIVPLNVQCQPVLRNQVKEAERIARDGLEDDVDDEFT